MELIIQLIVQIVAGGAGGNVIGQLAKNLSLGGTGNTIAGAVGGVGGTLLAGMIPGLDGLVGSTMQAAGDVAAEGGDAAAEVAASGIDFGALVGQGATGLVGGGLLTLIAGFVKNNMMKS